MLYGYEPDDRRYMEMREAKQRYLAYAQEIERLEYKLNSDKIQIYEKRERLAERLEKSNEPRDTMEATFYRRFGVPGYEELKV